MLAYFIRRLAGGMVAWLQITCVLYSLLAPAYVPGKSWICQDCNIHLLAARYETKLALEKLWPWNYLTWLVEPGGTTVRQYTSPAHVAMHGARVPAQVFSLERVGHPEAGLIQWMLGLVILMTVIVIFQRRGRGHVFSPIPLERPSRRFVGIRAVW